jgi:glutaredoxin
MVSAREKAQKIIDENSVVVFSKSYCPYCRASKSLLNEKHAKYFLMELDEVGTCTSNKFLWAHTPMGKYPCVNSSSG